VTNFAIDLNSSKRLVHVFFFWIREKLSTYFLGKLSFTFTRYLYGYIH